MSSFKHSNKTIKPATDNSIRKRHWFAGSIIILVGSWITHTTTASIANPKVLKIAEPALMNQPLVSEDLLNTTHLDSGPASAKSTNSKKTFSLLPSGVKSDLNFYVPIEESDVVIQPALKLKAETHKIKNGESLGIIFKKNDYDLSLPYKISQHPQAKRLVSLSVGKIITFKFDDTDALRQISYPVSPLKELVVDFDESEITQASVNDLDYKTKEFNVSAQINSSLFLSAQKAGLSHNIIMEMVRIFGWDIDFTLDIRPGDSYHIIYTEHHKDGKKLSDGDILAAEFVTQGQRYRAFRFVDEKGNVSFYNPEGKSMLGTFLRSPVKFSRISSRFGKRKHPISKKWKAHKGTDYAAARGTPIHATANGKIISAGRKGGYGKTVVIRHAGRFSTLYAHMNGFAKGIRSGSRVKQGDVIGYVGSTGYSTGPHLHYEFRVDGVHRNSLTYKTPKASAIPDSSMLAFQNVANEFSNKLDVIEKEYLIAQSKNEEKTTL